MADLAFYYELAGAMAHGPEVDMMSDFDMESYQLDTDMFPDIFSAEPTTHYPPPLVIETAALNDDACKDPDFLGPWADSNQIAELQACVSKPTSAVQTKQKPLQWEDLSKETQHYLIKAAVDYHLQQQQHHQRHQADSDKSSAEARKTVFWKAMDSLAVDTIVAEALSTEYQVKRRKTPSAEPNFNPARDDSTIVETINEGTLADVVRKAQDYVVGAGRNFLLPAIAQSTHLVQQNLLETSYFGFPGLMKCQPAVGSLAESQAFASFRVATDQKGKPSERLLLRDIRLPANSLVYGINGVITLAEAGKYTFQYPEAYSQKLEKRDGNEVLLCTAMGSLSTHEKSWQNLSQPTARDDNAKPGEGYLDPSEISTDCSTLVHSVFHNACGDGGKAPIGPERYQRNATLEKVASDFKGFAGFLQFYLPKGFHVTGPTGKHYTLIFGDVQPGSFNAQRQLIFQDDFVLRMKLMQPAAMFRDLQLMPRVSEPGVHQFIAPKGQGVDLLCESGRYYIPQGMEPPVDVESQSSVDAQAEIVQTQAAGKAKDQRAQNLQRLLKTAAIVHARESQQRELADPEVTTGANPQGGDSTEAEMLTERDVDSPMTDVPSGGQGNHLGASATPTTPQINLLGDEEKELRHKLIIEEAEKTLEPYRKRLMSQERKERSDDQKQALSLMEQQQQEKESLRTQQKPGATNQKRNLKRSVEDEEFKPGEAARSKKKAKVFKEDIHKPRPNGTKPTKATKPPKRDLQQPNQVRVTNPAKPKVIKDFKVISAEETTTGRKRQRPVEGDDGNGDAEVNRPQKRANKASLMVTDTKQCGPKKNRTPKNEPARERSVQCSPSRASEDGYSGGTSIDSDIESSRRGQAPHARPEIQGPATLSRPAYTQGFDPVSGRPIITMHASPEIAAVMARFPPGARFRPSGSGLNLTQITMPPVQEGHHIPLNIATSQTTFQPVPPLTMPAVGTMNALAQIQYRAQLAWQQQMWMTAMMASMNQQNPAMAQQGPIMGQQVPVMGQNMAADTFRAMSAAPGSQLHTPTSPAFPQSAEASLKMAPAQAGCALSAARETIEIIDGPDERDVFD
ncbi:hypothetical protein Micbo1qcDRAFT_180472 [Microdochium bolleyi]|uniref:Uncharacterized protein n=1 Tax=Microdochium bolleyi TaxID=196109 RepID=A0A136ILG6_9PEZI|nr:hypothetical protein Micbo1qcDRAFT_180472 [Microdochium bolleyi]